MTISASELRIGNWVLVDGKFIQVENINEDGINQEIESGYYGAWETKYAGYFNDWWGNEAGLVQPIPITEDILTKFGFYELSDGDHSEYLHNDLPIFLYWGTGNPDGSDAGYYLAEQGGNPKSANQQHVHQIQNLAFALYHKEISINL